MAMYFVVCEKILIDNLITFPTNVSLCMASLYNPKGDGACQKGESDAGSGGRQVMNSSAPNGLKRHPIIGLIDEIYYTCFWIMPQNMFKVLFWFCLTEIYRVPVGKRSGTGHQKTSIVQHNELKWIDSMCSFDDFRVRYIGIFFSQGQSADLHVNSSKKNRQQSFKNFQ